MSKRKPFVADGVDIKRLEDSEPALPRLGAHREASLSRRRSSPPRSRTSPRRRRRDHRHRLRPRGRAHRLGCAQARFAPWPRRPRLTRPLLRVHQWARSDHQPSRTSSSSTRTSADAARAVSTSTSLGCGSHATSPPLASPVWATPVRRSRADAPLALWSRRSASAWTLSPRTSGSSPVRPIRAGRPSRSFTPCEVLGQGRADAAYGT